MFLPVFVHPGKRGPSPVKKSPEKSTAKGGPPAPPSATSSAPPSRPHLSSSRPMVSPAAAPTTPGQSNACLSLHSLVARKKISTSSRPRPPSRAPGRFFPHTCVKASHPHTHTCAHTHTYIHTRTYAEVRARGAYIPPVHPRVHAEETYARCVRRAEDGRRCFRVCNLDSQSFHILLPLEPIHK